MKITESTKPNLDFHTLLRPENDLEYTLLEDPGFLAGLDWGLPRYGHPEGKIYLHMLEVLQNIDRLGLDGDERFYLRGIAFLHDTFKYREKKGAGIGRKAHHGYLARSFAEVKAPELESVYDLIEWHDEAYFAWRKIYLQGKKEEGQQRLQHLQELMGERMDLFYYFFWCDTRTGDKNPAPLVWFEKKMESSVSLIPHREPLISWPVTGQYKSSMG